MSQLHRIQWIDRQIRDLQYPNCTKIANQFCISPRQASRDIEYLRYSLDAPIEYSSKKNGYYYTNMTFVLPGIQISDETKKALSFLADQYQTVNNEMARRLAALFSRLSESKQLKNKKEQINDSLLIHINEKNIKIYHKIKECINNKQKIKILYMNLQSKISRRILHPYKIFLKNSHPLLVAFCEKRNEIKLFNIKRVKELHRLSENFNYIKEYKPENYSDKYMIEGKLPYEAKIKLLDNFSIVHIKRELHKDMTFTEPDTILVRFHHSHKLIGLLISLDLNFSIIKPKWLKEKYRNKLKNI